MKIINKYFIDPNLQDENGEPISKTFDSKEEAKKYIVDIFRSGKSEHIFICRGDQGKIIKPEDQNIDF